MVDTELISRKLSRLQSYVDELRAATDVSWETCSGDSPVRERTKLISISPAPWKRYCQEKARRPAEVFY